MSVLSHFHMTLPIADCKLQRCRSFLLLTTHNSSQSLINLKSTFQEGIIAIIYFSSVMFPQLFFDIYESRMSSFISRQAVKTGKSLLLQQQRRRNSSGSTADNGTFHG